MSEIGTHAAAVDRSTRIDVASADLPAQCRSALDAGARMQMAYAWFPGESSVPEVRYLLHWGGERPLQLWRCRPAGNPLPSLAPISPLLSWYEREITDLCGVAFSDQPQPEPLVLLPGAHTARPALRPGPAEPIVYTPSAPNGLPRVIGPASEDVQRLPFGPIRADVLESAQFDFYYLGEAILHYHPQLFFKHRAMEKRFEGVTSGLGVVLAERVSAVGGVAHSLAYCQAIETAARCEVPPRAAWLRSLLAELERLYNHLHYLGHLCHTTTLKVGEAQGKYLEELAKQMNARATGSRLLRSLLIPGGLRREPSLEGITDALDDIMREYASYADMLEASTPHLDRLITTGELSPQLAFDQGATGPIERASGLDRDLRRDYPYAAYRELPFEVALKDGCDAHAREQVRMAEISQSIELIHRIVQGLPAGPIRAPCEPRGDTEGLGWAESPRGSLYYAVHLDRAGRLARVKIKSPSFSNWRVFPFTVHDSNMMDYAINEASFGLTVAGCAR
ncbi:MAG: NADH-quinone oxidoreductase subunit C [Steroidobacteraceae bacterium]